MPSGILIHASIWPQQIWAENWGLCPFRGWRGESPSNTVGLWPGPRPICMPSFVLIRPTVWPQCTNVTDRQTGSTDRQTDNGPIAQCEPFYNRSPKNVKHSRFSSNFHVSFIHLVKCFAVPDDITHWQHVTYGTAILQFLSISIFCIFFFRNRRQTTTRIN